MRKFNKRVTIILMLMFISTFLSSQVSKREAELREAAQKGQTEKVENIIRQKRLFSYKNLSINSTDKKGRTALMLAAEKGHLNVVKLLLENGADLEIVNHKGETALDKAIKKKKERIIVILEFAQVKLNQNIEEYKNFIEKYPENEFIDEAKNGLMKLEYLRAKETHNIEKYRQFIDQYPNNEYTEKSQAGIRNIELRYLLRENSIKSYEDYIVNHPESNFSSIITDQIQLIKLGCKYQDDRLIKENEEEIESIFQLIKTNQNVMMLSMLYEFLIRKDNHKDDTRSVIQIILRSAIDKSAIEQYTDNSNSVNKLLDFYTFDSTFFPEYSYEAGLARELQVMTSRQFIRKKISKLPSREQEAQNFTNAVMKGANPQALLEQTKNIISFRNSAHRLVYAVDLKAIKDLANKPLTDCAKFQYWLLADKILSGVYENPYEYGLEHQDLKNPEFKNTPNYQGRLKLKAEKEKEIYDILVASFDSESNEYIKSFAADILKRISVQ